MPDAWMQGADADEPVRHPEAPCVLAPLVAKRISIGNGAQMRLFRRSSAESTAEPVGQGPIDFLLRSPPSTAGVARVRRGNSQEIFTIFAVHEDAQHVHALPKEVTIDCRAALFVRQGVGLMTALLMVEGELYETWLNFHNPAYQKCFYDLCEQDKLVVSFYVDRSSPERKVWLPNFIRPRLKEVVKLLEAMEPWEMAAFDRAREELYREFPTPQALWAGAER